MAGKEGTNKRWTIPPGSFICDLRLSADPFQKEESVPDSKLTPAPVTTRAAGGRRTPQGAESRGRTDMSTIDRVLMIVASLLLLSVDWLAFHDFHEAHTVRDWLMLLASALVFIQFARGLWKRNPPQAS